MNELTEQQAAMIYFIISVFLFQLSVAYSENFKEIKAWEVLKFLKRKNRNLTNLYRLAAKADRVYVMPSLYFVRKFYNLRTYAALP